MRFPEFSGEWKKCIIQDYGEVITGNTPPTNNAEYYNNGSYLWASPADLGTGKKINDTKTKLSESGFKKTRIIPKGSILVTCIGSTIGKIGMAVETMSSNQQINSIIVNEKSNNDFVYYAISRAFPRYLSEVGVQAVPILSKSNFEKLPNYTTSIEEQDKTGYFLNLLDERIATQNKIIEDLKKLKCAIIEKVLNGNNANNLRLGDVGSYIRGLTYSSDDVVEYNSTLVMRSNNIVNGSLLDYQNNVVSVNKQISQEQQLQDGDIIICMANGSSALVGKSSFYDGKCISPITVGAFCGIYRSKTAITKWLFQTNRYRRYIWNSLQGGNGAIANLNSEDILRMSFPLPDKQTAERCIKLLSSLESLIESNISLCSKFFQQKEYLLRQMFI
ncbi:restriction endonuclease subunit S [Bacteroides fragilis]|nr:restriction endonuclease subunit S [Bacteroides fragilis]